MNNQQSIIAIKGIRRILLITFLFGVAGTGIELWLVGHSENVWQWVPLALFLISIAVLAYHAAAQNRASVRIFQTLMVLFIASGLIGIVLHYEERAAFKLETNPELTGMQLLLETIQGATIPPVLAPGLMMQLGLIGLAYAYRHPFLYGAARHAQAKEL